MSISLLEFDPYADWLGIKVSQRPLNPYELLNLVPLDADRGRVRSALDRQKTILEGKRTTAEPEIWQALHDELESAAATLLDPERRAVVDASIKRKALIADANRPSGNGKPHPPAKGHESLLCPNCHRENSASRRFCGGCGHCLWDTCPQCHAEVSTLERFCGRCGLDVRGATQEQTRQIEERLAAAASFVQEHRFDSALSALRQVAAVHDPKLEQWAERALRKIDEVESLRQQAFAEAAAAKDEAAKLVMEKKFDWAVKVLENIPPPLRDEQVSTLLSQAQFASKELATLVSDIREAAEQGRTWDLFPKIDRLLALKPDHQAVLDLADQLRRKFVVNARKRLADQRYADTAQMLLQIPVALRTDEVQSLLDKASELAALLADLKHSPYATASAVALAQRLVKYAPEFAEAARLCQQLEQRCAARPSNPRLAMPPWTKPGEQSAVGPPVQWLGHFVRAQPGSDQVNQTLREHPGEFFLALGLALQGLDEGAIDISLMPPDERGMLAKFASLPLLKRGATSAWGIDLGGYALKALKLVKHSSGHVKVESVHHILLSKPLAHPDAEGDRSAILTTALAELTTRSELKGSRIATALSGHLVLGRFYDLPPLPAKKIPSAVEYEARHQIPIDLAELCWAWSALGETGAKQPGEGPRPMMVVAARKSHVEERLGLFQAAGIRVDLLQSDCVALHNAIRFEFAGQTPPAAEPVALMDIGADETNFVVSSPQSVWFRSFGLGGHSFTAALLQQFQLTYDHAEQLKRHPAKARRYHSFRQAIEPLLVQLAGEIDRSLASFRRLSSPTDVQQLYALGGGTHLHGLLRHCIVANQS